MPNVRRAVVVSAAAAVVVAVAGCTGSSSPAPTGTSTWPGGSTTTTSTPSTTTSSSTTTAALDLATRFPRTKAGAEGFVKEYFAKLNAAYQEGKVGDLSLYASPDCLRCRDWLAEFTQNERSAYHSLNTFVTVRDVQVVGISGNTAVAVTQLSVPEAKVVNSKGVVVHTRKNEGNVQLNAKLLFTKAWQVVATEVPQ
jgi:hypothetical protein